MAVNGTKKNNSVKNSTNTPTPKIIATFNDSPEQQEIYKEFTGLASSLTMDNAALARLAFRKIVKDHKAGVNILS